MFTKCRRIRVFDHSIALLQVIALVTALALQPAGAMAAPATEAGAVLSIVDVSFPAVNCVFDSDCTITVADTTDVITLPGSSGQGFLQSRTLPVGEAGTQAAGLYGFEYRIDLRNITANTPVPCITEMGIDFGPIQSLDYDGTAGAEEVYVGTSGGIGTVGPSSAQQSGNTVAFQFNPPVCAGQSSYFFGLASTQPARPVTAQLTGTPNVNLTVGARAPQGAPSTCVEIFDPETIPAPAIIDFDDVGDAVELENVYRPSHGLRFGNDTITHVISYADRSSDPTKARSSPNVAINDARFPATSANVPLEMEFNEGKSHVGFYMGNGESAGLAALLLGYDAAGNEICRVAHQPVPERYTEFLGIHDPAARIRRVTLDYGDTALSESIDDLYFAPNAPDGPIFEGPAIEVEILQSDNTQFGAAINFPAPQLLPVQGADGKSYQQFLMPGIDPMVGRPGLPGVPIYHMLLAVPRGAEAIVDDVQAEPLRELSVLLYPTQPEAADAPVSQPGEDVPVNVEDMGDPPFQKDEEAYAETRPMPMDVVSVHPVGQVRDLDLVQVSVAAGRYVAAQEYLVIFKEVAFTLKYEGGEGGFLPEEREEIPFEQHNAPLYALAKNSAAVFEYPYSIGELVFDCPGEELLIITDPAFRVAAETLRTWKIAKGISTSIIETGSGAGEAGVTAEEIRDTIKTRYDTCLVRPSYVLLLGDAEHIPTFYLPTLYGDLAGSDLPYSTMGIDEFFATPDLGLGRIPVDTLSDAQTVVNKIVAYESSPPLASGFYNDMTLAAYFQCCRPEVASDGTASRSFVETAEMVRSHLNGLGYNMERIYDTGVAYHSDPTKPGYYDSSTRSSTPNRYYNGALLPPDLRASSGYAWDGDTADVVAAFNAGRGLILHRDHGSISGWGSPGFYSSNLASLSNGNLTPVVYSVNCASGLFDNETRNPANDYYTYPTSVSGSYWAEKLLRMAGGAAGIIGDTRNSPTWANSALTRGLFDATWPTLLPGDGGPASIRRLGDVLNYAKLYTINQIWSAQTAGDVSQNAAVTDQAIYHLFGDPTMELWTSVPWRVELPTVIERLIPIPGGWTVRYPINRTQITALADGEPVARGTVVDGEAVLQAVAEPGAPDELVLSATLENAVATRLHVASATAEIGPEGGTLTTDEGMTVQFPAAAMTETVRLLYAEPLVAPEGDGSVKRVRGFSLHAYAGDGTPVTQVAGEFTIKFDYDEEAIGVAEGSLHCAYWDEAGGAWANLPGQLVAEQNQLRCTSDHLSDFGILGVPGVHLPIIAKQ